MCRILVLDDGGFKPLQLGKYYIHNGQEKAVM
jgi:hypothetical protein